MRVTAFAFTFILSSFITGYSDLHSDIPVFVFLCILCAVFSVDLKKSVKRNILSVSACILIFIFGVFYNNYGIQRLRDSADNYLENNSGEITGVVYSDINVYDVRSEFYVKTDDGVNIKVKYFSTEEIATGDSVKISDAEIYKISSENRIKKFNTRLLGENCLLYTEINSENLEVTGVKRSYIPMNYAYKLKKATFYKLLKYLEYNEAALAQAIFTSDSTHLSYEINDMLTKTGTIHISTVSGFHFALLGSLILFILKIFFASHKKRVVVLSIIMTCFAFYTGLSLPVLRALFAFLIINLSDIFNIKRADKNNLFMVLMSAFILFSPMLVYDISFILTLISNGAIVFFCAPLERIQAKKSEKHISLSTVIITLVMMPFVFSIFGRISVVSIFANYLVEFTMAPILLLTGLVAVFTPLSSAFAIILRPFVKYFLFVLKVMSVPESLTPQLPFSFVSAIFLTLFIISVIYIFIKNTRVKGIVIASLALVCLVYSVIAPNFSDKAYVTFFGNNNEGVIISKNSHHIVIGTTEDLYYYSSSSALRQNEQIDLWILTDSLNTEISDELFKKYKIKEYSEVEYDEKTYDFKDMKITVNADFDNILYVLLEYGNEKLYISDRLDFVDYVMVNLLDCDVILLYNTEDFIEYYDVPDSVCVNEAMPYSVGNLHKNGIEFK